MTHFDDFLSHFDEFLKEFLKDFLEEFHRGTTASEIPEEASSVESLALLNGPPAQKPPAQNHLHKKHMHKTTCTKS